MAGNFAGNFRGQTFNALMQPRAVYDRPLTFRGAIAPLGTYQNPDGTEDVGFAWPGIITEPLKALQRLHENSYTEDGRLGMPNPEYQGNKDDALTALLSIYGGNALNPMAKVPANALASSAFKVEGKPSIAGSAVAGAEAKGARPDPSALQPKAEAMGDGIIAETVDDAYRTFLSKLQDDPQPTPTFGPPTPGVDPTKVREAFEIGLQRWHRSFGKYSKDVPSPYGPLDGRLGDDLPAVMDALKLASEAAGRQLNVVPRRYGSQYANLRTPTGDSWEVRVADHANQSVHHGESDFNIAPGGMTQEQFLELLPTIYSDTGKPSLMGSAVSSTIHDDSNSGAVNDPAWLEDFLRRYY